MFRVLGPTFQGNPLSCGVKPLWQKNHKDHEEGLTNCVEHIPWESNSYSVSWEVPIFNGIWRLIDVFTSAYHWELLWARLIQSASSDCVSVRSSYISAFHLWWYLFSRFTIQMPVCINILFYVCHVPSPSYILFRHWNDICQWVQIRVPHYAVFISLLLLPQC